MQQTFRLRTCGLNPNHWYVVAASRELTTQPLAVTLWQQDIVLYRDEMGKVHALEDRCPHRQVKLSQGRTVGSQLECAYHGWRFDARGNCAAVPYLQEGQKLPPCQIRSYPVQELDGFIWLFLGKNHPSSVPVLGLPEWTDLNYIATVSVIKCQAHYSFLIENLMDMYHGHLHQDYQAWSSAVLRDVQANDWTVSACYEAQSYYKIDKIWSVSQLFFPALRRLHPDSLNVSYVYPHWQSNLGQDFKIYCLLCPVNTTYTRAYLIHFTSLQAFPRLHELPVWFRQSIKNSLFGCAQKMLDGLVAQDVVMIEQEQRAYLENPERRSYELNPTVTKVQHLIRQQAELAGESSFK